MRAITRTTHFARALARVPGFVRKRLTLEDALRTLRDQLMQREENFLAGAERFMYANETSPYRRMLELAGCEFGDLLNSVTRDGLEPTLERLRREGVYVSFEEFKGRTPIVRGGRVIDTTPAAFDNPNVGASLVSSTSGSTGPPMIMFLTLDRVADTAPGKLLLFHAHGAANLPIALWNRPTNAIGQSLVDAHLGKAYDRLFILRESGEQPWSRRNQAMLTALRFAARIGGARIPRPEPLGIDQADEVARWAADQDGGCVLQASVGLGVRVAAAGADAGLDLDGLVIFAAGEPVTPAKTRVLEKVGARWAAHYASVDFGRIGIGCPANSEGSDYHVMDSNVAVIQHPRRMADESLSVNAFHFTSLLPAATKILLNVESDDYGVLHSKGCGCPIESAGFARHVTGVASFAKLTAEGVSLLDLEVLRILQDVLPARFGGSPFDYQLLEDEDGGGVTRLVLRVDPRLGPVDEAAVVAAFYEELGGSELTGAVRGIWRQARTIMVEREPPLAGASEKFRPIVHAIQRPAGRR